MSAGVLASDIDPIYTTSAFLNIGSTLEPKGLQLDVVSIPASRLRYGIDPHDIAAALQGEGGEYSAQSPTIHATRKLFGPEALINAIAWTITAATARANDRRDLDPTDSHLDQYSQTWSDLSPLLEAQILGATKAPLFVIENSPPVFKSAIDMSGAGLVTLSYATGNLNAATLVVSTAAVFVMHAMPTAGRAFGDYLKDLIEKLPGSNRNQ